MTPRNRRSIRVGAGAAVATAAALLAVGCGPSVPDYQSIWSTTSSPTTTTPAETPMQPFAAYLENLGVSGSPVDSATPDDLVITIPTPAGWEPYVSENLAPGTRTIAKSGGGYPNATLVVFELTGPPFDEAEAINHADADAEMSENFKKLAGSRDALNGFPSSMIQGSYDLQGQRMQTYNRVVLATGKPPQQGQPGKRYLVQLTVTSFADEAQANSAAIEAIINGFTVKVP